MNNQIVCRVFSGKTIPKLTRKNANLTIRNHNDRLNESYSNKDIIKKMSIRNIELNEEYDKTKDNYISLFDKKIEQGIFRTTGLKPDAQIFDELLHDVNSEYWLTYKEHGFDSPYEFALEYFNECYKFDCEKFGKDKIISFVIHADEINRPLTDKYGYDIWHYHAHAVVVPTVEKVKYFSKRSKDKAGQVKERFQQVSRSKFWESKKGEPKSYEILQDEIYNHMQKTELFKELTRGTKGSKKDWQTVPDFKERMDEQRKLDKKIEAKKQEIELLKMKKEELLLSPTETILEDPQAKEFISEFNTVLKESHSNTYPELELEFNTKDDKWLNDKVEIYDEHISLLKTEKYIKMPLNEWENKKKIINVILKRSEKIKKFFNNKADGFIQSWNKIANGPSALKIKEYEKMKKELNKLGETSFDQNQEIQRLKSENENLKWYKTFYGKIIPILDKSFINGQNTFQYILNMFGFDLRTIEIIKQDLNKLNSKKNRSKMNR